MYLNWYFIIQQTIGILKIYFLKYLSRMKIEINICEIFFIIHFRRQHFFQNNQDCS